MTGEVWEEFGKKSGRKLIMYNGSEDLLEQGLRLYPPKKQQQQQQQQTNK